jgi:hypothetical protein
LSANLERPPGDVAVLAATAHGGLNTSTASENTSTLGALHVGARLVLRCRKDWRDATVVAVTDETVTLSVTSPRGRTYRLRRPPDSTLYLDGHLPVLGEGHWRTTFARYDSRW